jgi:hypothetical protein
VVGAVRLDVGIDRRGAAGAVGDVELDHAGVAAQGGHFGGDGVRIRAPAAAVHDDVKAVARQAQGDGAADAAAGAGDENETVGHEFGFPR